MRERDIRFRPRAEADFIQIYDFIAEKSGSDRSWEIIQRIRSACLSLALMPERGVSRDDLAPGIRTINPDRMVTIAYRVLPGFVEIVALAWAGQDIDHTWRDL